VEQINEKENILDSLFSNSKEDPLGKLTEKLRYLIQLLFVINVDVITMIVALVFFAPKVLHWNPVKAGVNIKAVFWLGILMKTSRLRFKDKQSKISLLTPHILMFWAVL